MRQGLGLDPQRDGYGHGHGHGPTKEKEKMFGNGLFGTVARSVCFSISVYFVFFFEQSRCVNAVRCTCIR